EEDLKKVFAERADFKYLSDVEPDCKAELTEKYAARYYATPKKMGAQTEEANVNSGLAAANQIVKFFATGDITFKVNK
ncbi:MAG TPA: 3-phosphoglycerate dehydrogenase, partial [Bacteroidales bacterium]|nr:3-phosphoglycerate dehydrogenase [Bacteroidales bacterium]